MDIPPAGSTEIGRILGQPEQIGKQVSSTERLAARPQLTTRRRKVTTEILVETTESILIWRGGEATKRWCAQCGRKTETVTVEQAAAALGVSTHSIQTWIETGHLHTFGAPKVLPRICAGSLALLPGDDLERL